MKILILLILFTLAFAESKAQISPAQQEAAKLNAEIIKLFRQQKFDEALPLAQKVVEIKEKDAGKTHLSTGQAWVNLAHIQQQRGKFDEARKAFETAFDVYELNQPLAAGDEKAFVELLDITATYQANDGKYEKAGKKLQRALELQEKSFGKDSLEASGALFKLGQVEQLDGEYGKSATLFLRALEIRAAKLGSKSEETREVFSNAVCSLTKLGEEKQAEELRGKYYPPKNNNLPTEGKIPIAGGQNSGIINGKALDLAKPRYPAEARANRAKGAVMVQVTINEAGNVVFACAVKGDRALHKASENAAYQSKFAPTVLDGKAVRISGVLIYNFVP